MAAFDAPEPVYVLRGHATAVNAVRFIGPECLATGDGDGEARLWDLSRRRAACSWRAHDKGILEILVCDDTLVTQARVARDPARTRASRGLSHARARSAAGARRRAQNVGPRRSGRAGDRP